MNILITGSAGFIGFNISEHFLRKNYKVFGVDNFDDYYSVKLKRKRISILKNYKNFHFFNIDLTNSPQTKKVFKGLNFEFVFHFAAQAGVRYSLINPQKYVNSNIVSFINLLENIKHIKIKKFVYASSSSVYGNSKKFPCTENQKLEPINIYSKSKEFNEKVASFYSKTYAINMIGLRFFTIFGEWGRPDMLLIKIFEAIRNKEKISINNYGNHYRDFTYIGDVKKIFDKILNKRIIGHKIFNICSSKPINILKVCNNFKNQGLKIKKIAKHSADVLKTYGSNKRIKKLTSVKFANQMLEINKLYYWYNKTKMYRYLEK
jgi:UDP-glucuronate 4-epimerase